MQSKECFSHPAEPQEFIILIIVSISLSDGSFKANNKKKGKKSLYDKLKEEVGAGKPEKGTKRKVREEIEAMPLSKKKKENRHFMKRLTHDELFKLAQESKIVWEKIRLKDIEPAERAAAIEEHLDKIQVRTHTEMKTYSTLRPSLTLTLTLLLYPNPNRNSDHNCHQKPK